MKYASAMKYGGELVAAVDCDYNSFKELVPLCPHCKEPVFLRAGGIRESAKGSLFEVGPHWCHFKGTSKEQVAGCELRVNGYTEKDRAKIAAQARGQRLKLLQRWFWEVLVSSHKESFETGIESAIKKADNFKDRAAPWFQHFIDLERERGSDPHREWVKTVEHVIHCIQTKSQCVFSGKNLELQDEWKVIDHSNTPDEELFPVLIEFQKKYLEECVPFETDLTSQQHARLVKEVCSFLWSRHNVEVLTSIFMLGFWEVIDYADQQPWFQPPGFKVWRDGKLFVDMPMSFSSVQIKTSLVSSESKMIAINQWSWIYQIAELHVLYLIASIPWASEFQRLESEAKQRKESA
jgi:hypothetical protein